VKILRILGLGARRASQWSVASALPLSSGVLTHGTVRPGSCEQKRNTLYSKGWRHGSRPLLRPLGRTQEARGVVRR
jgi:hypothetical protein